jgi:hypothetical protein
MADERRDERDRDRDRDRDDPDRGRRERCRPWYGKLYDRLEALRREDRDEALEILRTIIDAAFFQGIACCCMECKCEDHDEDKDRRRREL